MEQIARDLPTRAGISTSYGHAWKKLWVYFLPLALVTLVVGLAESPNSVWQESDSDRSLYTLFLYLIATVYSLLLLPVLKYGAALVYVKAMRDEKPQLETFMKGFRENYFNIVLAHLIRTALIILGLVFFIVPGIILACRLVFVPYLVMDKNLDPMAAIEKSWDLTRNQGWRVFGMALLAIPIFILGLLCFLVGAFIAVMWISAAFASLYEILNMQDLKKNDPYLVS
ncbi:MAG: hypothetical protein AB3N14_02520 [Flavobacteriaceae bacterium]